MKALPILTTAALVLLAGCGDDELRLPNQPPSGSDDPPAGDDPVVASVELYAPPQIVYDEANGKTSVAVRVVARTAADAPISPDELEVTILIDGEEIDSEALLDESSEELEANLVLWPTLDASYSMVVHDPPAFEPMLIEAQRTVSEGVELYDPRPGDFAWELCWFNDYLFMPTGPAWNPGTIRYIEAPAPGTLTKLFAAVAFQARRSLTHWTDAGSPENVSHLMVVFSDGADTYSHFDNSDVLETVEGAGFEGSYVKQGYEATPRADAIAAIEAHPALQVHVIGMGDDVNQVDLEAIAAAGGGRYFQGSSSDLTTLFNEVIKEFSTVQSHGLLFAWPPGDYDFELRLSPSESSEAARIRFRFHAGDASAGVIEEG